MIKKLRCMVVCCPWSLVVGRKYIGIAIFKLCPCPLDHSTNLEKIPLGFFFNGSPGTRCTHDVLHHFLLPKIVPVADCPVNLPFCEAERDVLFSAKKMDHFFSPPKEKIWT